MNPDHPPLQAPASANPQPAASPASSPDFAPDGWSGLAPLPAWGVIAAEGADAASFLHNQLSNDFALLGPTEARLAALCNAKGRMLASFIGFKRGPERVLLLCARDLLPQTLQHLQRFVLRAKVSLSDASDRCSLWGAVGAAVAADLPAPTWSKRDAGALTWVRLPAVAGLGRALLCLERDEGAHDPARFPAQAAPLPPAHWDWLQVRSAVVLLSQPLVELLVPQMLNYESVGGVNFKKGCYPGQEVVARSQFRGILKRRAYLAHCPTGTGSAPAAGQAVFHPSDAEQPCGVVVQAAAHPAGGVDALLSLQTSAADGQTLRLGTPDGAALHLLPLPYELLADV
ncbi:MAG: folate-binding protein [Pseudomonadota bacterium]|jgi:folate-binding protein YgfZ